MSRAVWVWVGDKRRRRDGLSSRRGLREYQTGLRSRLYALPRGGVLCLLELETLYWWSSGVGGRLGEPSSCLLLMLRT